jgi:hypothetical protein
MTTTNNVPSGSNGAASGEPEIEKKDTVSYDTHRKLLDEKKRLQADRDELARKIKEQEDLKAQLQKEELEKQGNFQKLLDSERAEHGKTKEELDSIRSGLEEARKRNAVMKFIAGTIPPEAASAMLNVEGVALNADGSINDDTAKVVAQEFEKRHPYLVIKRQGSGMPNEAANGGAKKLSYKEWCALPSSKEMQKRYNDVDWSTA